MTEIYSLINDFSGGLSNHQLKQIINDNITITTNCNDVNINNDIVTLSFDSVISGAERTELNIIITNYVYDTSDSIDKKFIAVSFDFDNITTQGVSSSNHIILNKGTDYIGSFNTTSGEILLNEKGVYTFSLFYDNKTVLSTDFFKIYMEEQTGSNSIYSRNVVCHNEVIGELDQIISATMVLYAGDKYKFICKQILGNSNASFNCILQVIRNE